MSALKSFFKKFQRGDRKKHDPVVCVSCDRPISDELEELHPCNHVFCIKCFEDYCSVPQMLMESDGSTCMYCPACLKPCNSRAKSSSLPEGLKALVKAVTGKKCHCHSKKDIIATCASCMEACCSTCVTKHPAGHNVIQSDTAWPLDDLVKRVNDYELYAAQAEQLQKDQDDALECAKAQARAYTRHQIDVLRDQEAEVIKQLENHHTKVQSHIKVLQKLAPYMADATKQHITYLHSLQQNQPERRTELLVNQPALQARTQTLLLDKAQPGRSLIQDICLHHIKQMPCFQGGDSPAKHGTVSFQQHGGPSPAVSHTEWTLDSIVRKPDDPDTPTDDGKDACSSDIPSYYRLRDKPPHLFDVYSSCPNMEPGSALFLNDRLVITERKGHKISIWKINVDNKDKQLALEIKNESQRNTDIFPYAVTYWANKNRLVYTDFRHWTVGLVAPNGENMTSLKHEILRTPHGVGVLPSDCIAASDNDMIHKSKRQVKIIDMDNSKIVNTFHKHKDGVHGDDHRNPTWITVLKDGRVTVTDAEANAVFLYDGDGRYIKHFSVPCPEQVIEDPHGDLLIASGGGFGSGNKVLLYDARELRHRKDVLTMHHCPQSIALNHFGQLVVVHKTGVVQMFELYDC